MSRLCYGALIAATLVLGCRDQRPKAIASVEDAGRPKPPVRAKPTVIEQTLLRVVASCELSDSGWVRSSSCEDKAPLKELKHLHIRLGEARLAHGLCQALDHQDNRVRLVAGQRLGEFAYPYRVRAVAEDDVYQCLIKAFGKLRTDRSFEPRVAQLTMMVAVALGKGKQAIASLKKHPVRRIQRRALRALWPVGRLDVLPQIESVLADPHFNDDAKLELIRGFERGEGMSPAERQAVCKLIERQLGSEGLGPRRELFRQLGLCPNGKRRAITMATKLLLSDGSREMFRFLRSSVTSSRVSLNERAAILKTFGTVVTAANVSSRVRLEALRTLERLDKWQAIKAAKRLLGDPVDSVRRAAERLVNQPPLTPEAPSSSYGVQRKSR